MCLDECQCDILCDIRKAPLLLQPLSLPSPSIALVATLTRSDQSKPAADRGIGTCRPSPTALLLNLLVSRPDRDDNLATNICEMTH